MRHLLPLQTQKSPYPVARTSSESGIDVTAEHHFEKSFDHSSTSLYHPHHKKFRVCFPPPTFAPVITKQVVAGVSFLPSFFDLLIQNHSNNTLHYSLSSTRVILNYTSCHSERSEESRVHSAAFSVYVSEILHCTSFRSG